MSRLNTMCPNDDFLKGISNVMGKIDSKNEIEIKQEIEQVGYKEFYRYYKEKNVYINQLKRENKELQSQLEQKENNWNKLKEWLEEESKLKGTETAYLYYGRTLNKMQEIEVLNETNY